MSPAALENFVNAVEIFVWIAIALVIARRAATTGNRKDWLPAAAFFAFGISDAIEMSTGAWWKPWWLLVWKVTCVAIIARFFWQELRRL
ncbi:MAG: hypothetical protein ACI9R3_006003 [Verrucomicrobiales bacterium]|jgi:hypothetical protein